MAIIKRIAQHLYLNGDFVGDVSLLNGRSGIALFAYYYSRAVDDSHYWEYADYLLETVCQNIPESMEALYETGTSGIGRFLTHLVNNDFADIDNEDVFYNLDQSLLQYLKCECRQQHRLSQIIGPSVYFYDRINRFGHSCSSQTASFHGKIDFIARQLSLKWVAEGRSAQYNIQNAKQLSELIQADRNVKNAFYEPSVIPTLMQMFRQNPGEKLLKKLLDHVFKAQQLVIAEFEDIKPSEKRKQAWYAYWVHLSLLMYAQLMYVINTGDAQECALHYIERIRYALLQLTSNEMKITETEKSVLSGNLKIVLTCNALYRFTNDPFFITQREKLLERYLNARKGTIAGIYAGSYKISNFSFDKGLSGIGLVLLSCMSDQYLPWEELVFHYDLISYSCGQPAEPFYTSIERLP